MAFKPKRIFRGSVMKIKHYLATDRIICISPFLVIFIITIIFVTNNLEFLKVFFCSMLRVLILVA